MKKIVIALGGNALQEAGKPATAEAQLEVVEKTSEYIADIIGEGYKVIIAHGNGPQVGRIVLQNEYATPVSPAMPFDVCGAMSQGYIGFHLQKALGKRLAKAGVKKAVATIVTQVAVDRHDPAFEAPTKPIGGFYTKEQAEALMAENPGWLFKDDAGRGWRRVVASPKPVEIVERDAVRALIEIGVVVIACGGGGVPVTRAQDGGYESMPAVIDKDFAAALLAKTVDADRLVILTAVEQVNINWGKPDQKPIGALSLEEAERYCQEGQFAPGSMLPKVQAAMMFAQTGGEAVIASLERAADALSGSSGTRIYKA